jgi:hypothetical protein
VEQQDRQAVARARAGKPVLTPGQRRNALRNVGFQTASEYETGVQSYAKSRPKYSPRRQRIEHLIDAAHYGWIHPTKIAAEYKRMRLTPQEQRLIERESARRSTPGPDIGGAVIGLTKKAMQESRGRYVGSPREAIRQDIHNARTATEAFTGIDPRHPRSHGDIWLAANAALLAPGALVKGPQAALRATEAARAARGAEGALGVSRGLRELPRVVPGTATHVFKEAKSAAKLRARLNPRWAKSGEQENVRLKRGGHHVLGRITPQAWVKRADHVNSPEEVKALGKWYSTVRPLFEEVFGPDAENILRGFGASQANASPTTGMENVLKVVDKLRAGKRITSREISTVVKSIEQGVKGEPISKGIAAKLSDFIDSVQASPTRTWMGHAVEGGKPTAIDVHALRDLGWVDKRLISRLEAKGLKKGVHFKVDSRGVATGGRYENAVRQYQAITDHANKIRWHGRSDWTPAEIQAIGWGTIQKFHGVTPEDLPLAIERLTRRYSVPSATADALHQTATELGGYVTHAENGVVSVVASAKKMREIGAALAREPGAARVTWLKNKGAARHWQITLPHDAPWQTLEQLHGMGFTEMHKVGDHLVLIAPKKGVNFTTAHRLAEAADGSGGPIQLEEFGARGARARAAVQRNILGGGADLDAGVLAAIEKGAGRRLPRGGDGLNVGINFGFERGGEHGLLPDAVRAVGRRLRGEERGQLGGAAEDLPPELPVHGPRTLEDEMAQAIQKPMKSVRRRQQAGYTPARAEKFARASEAYHAAGGGIAGREAYGRELAGELPKLNFTGTKHLGGGAEMDRLTNKIFDKLGTSPEAYRASGALKKSVLGVVPTDSEIALLERVFPPADVKKAVQLAKGERSKWEVWKDVLQIPRTMQSSGDISGLFRQALPVLTRHPTMWAEAIPESLKGAWSQERFDKWMADLRQKPGFVESTDAGVQYSKTGESFHGGKVVEEAYGSQLAEKLPIVGHSARQYTAFLDDLRLKLWNHLLPGVEADALKAAGKRSFGKLTPNRGLDPEEALGRAHADLARYVNSMTGRGPMPWKLKEAAPLLNAIFFSPRLLSSRFDLLLSPATYMRASPKVRRQAVRSMFQTVATGMGVLYAANQIPGWQVGLNPTSSDFGRIKIGDTRIDIWGGFQPIVKLFAQVKTGKITSSVTGEEEKLGSGKYGSKTDLSILMKFMREKLSPNASFVVDLADEQNVIGQPFKWKNQLWRMAPMLAHDIYETQVYAGPKAPAGVVGGLGALGFSTMTYGSKKARKTLSPRPSGVSSGLSSLPSGLTSKRR